jgi:hypothetical protein
VVEEEVDGAPGLAGVCDQKHAHSSESAIDVTQLAPPRRRRSATDRISVPGVHARCGGEEDRGEGKRRGTSGEEDARGWSRADECERSSDDGRQSAAFGGVVRAI